MDEEILIQILKEMGYNPRIYINPIHLRGYKGDKRPQKSHIVIDRHQVGSVSNDIGFERKGNEYILHISEYDEKANTFDVKKMKTLYNVQKVLKTINQNSRFHLKKKKKLQDGRYEINVDVLR